MKKSTKLILIGSCLATSLYASQPVTKAVPTTTVANQTDLTTALDAQVNQVMSAKNIPGYHLTVIKNGQVIYNKGFGYADQEAQIPVTNQTVFGLASITKTFTAMGLLKLVEEGTINLNDPLSKYIKNLTPAYQKMTIRQLASMTAGIPQGVPSAAKTKWPSQMQALIQQPLVSTPGQAYLYSNFSYRLLGQVIQNVTSQPYLNYIHSTILSPLQMNNTGTVLSVQAPVAAPYADNLGKGPLKRIDYRDPQIEFSAGMLASNSMDLIKYVQALMNHQILSSNSYQTLWYTRPNLPNGKPANWAFGWGSRIEADGKRIISMNGADPGVASSIIMVPETKCAVIGLSNLRDPAVYRIARRAAHLACGVQPRNQSTEPNLIPSGID